MNTGDSSNTEKNKKIIIGLIILATMITIATISIILLNNGSTITLDNDPIDNDPICPRCPNQDNAKDFSHITSKDIIILLNIIEYL